MVGTLTRQVSDLILLLVSEWEGFEEQGGTMVEFAERLEVKRPTLINWLNGANGIDLDPDLAERLGAGLGIPVTQVLELEGYDMSGEVPTRATLNGHSGPYPAFLGAVVADVEQLELDEVASIEDGTERRAAESLVDAADRFAARGTPDPEPEDAAAAGQVAA